MNNLDNISIIVSVIVALVGAVSGLVALRNQHKQADAAVVESKGEASESISTAVTVLIDPMNKRINMLESENTELKSRINVLEAKIKELESDNKALASKIASQSTYTDRLRHQILALGASPIGDCHDA